MRTLVTIFAAAVVSFPFIAFASVINFPVDQQDIQRGVNEGWHTGTDLGQASHSQVGGFSIHNGYAGDGGEIYRCRSKPAINYICFRGRPFPECRDFMIFEFGVKSRLTGSSVRKGKGQTAATLDFGYMRNWGTKSALGATLYGAVDDDGVRWGIRPRYRLWFAGHTTLDLSAGLLLGGDDSWIDPMYPGFVGSVSLGAADLFALSMMLEINRFEVPRYHPPTQPSPTEKGTQTVLYGGVTLQSYAGVVGLCTFVLAMFIAAAVWAGD